MNIPNNTDSIEPKKATILIVFFLFLFLFNVLLYITADDNCNKTRTLISRLLKHVRSILSSNSGSEIQ